ncbi:hypothetical protein ACFOOK_17810 [Micromonospora krabiensis]|uniref:Transglycosylase associated protein n=1 Tax=Micromonospora krabiensis TaxID=307121 RepID=A0A1C3MZE8_9ACTN|nr:hypothetical protein [Micromonospora krabiensis]SBV25700.1 hypothetical protein GA0070620_1177 [Micromonospora krabiensis]
MTGSALLSALVVGLAVGGAGRFVVPGRTTVPVWLTLALGVAAALLGSILVRVAGAGVGEPGAWWLLVQTGSAGLAVVFAVLAGRQRPADLSTGPAQRTAKRPQPLRRPGQQPGDDREEAR